jgi:hypothetical protein
VEPPHILAGKAVLVVEELVLLVIMAPQIVPRILVRQQKVV